MRDHLGNEKLQCYKVLDSLPRKCFERMNKRLVASLSLEELQAPVNSMTKGKVPRSDDLMVEFYTFF
jgi:hypothetical protein